MKISSLDKNSERYCKRLDKARKEKTSCMNNSKWFKFFSAIRQIDVFLPESRIKFLPSEQTYRFSFGVDFDEKGILDGLACGPFLFNEIEWILIPSVVEHERFNRDEKLQSTFEAVDLAPITETLNQLGKYEFEIGEEGLTLYGYK